MFVDVYKRQAQFKMKHPKPEMAEWGTPYFLAWTTTPWTLPSNTAVSYTHLDVYKRQGIYKDNNEAFATLEKLEVIEPKVADRQAYADAYARWKHWVMC